MAIRKPNATEKVCIKVFNRYRRERLLERIKVEQSAIAGAGSELMGLEICWLPALWQRLCQALLLPLIYLLLSFAAVIQTLISASSLLGLCALFCIPVRLTATADRFSVLTLFRALNAGRQLSNEQSLLCIEEWLVIHYGHDVALDIGFTQQVVEVGARHVRCQFAAYGQGSHISFVDPMSLVLEELEERLPNHD